MELVITLVIIGMAAAIAVPRVSGAIERQRVTAAANRIAADLNMAQARANMSSSTVVVDFTFATHRYQMPGIGYPSGAPGDYTVDLSASPYQAKLTSSNLGGLVVTGGIAQLSYGAFGLPSAGGNVTISVGRSTRTVTVDPVSGKARVQ